MTPTPPSLANWPPRSTRLTTPSSPDRALTVAAREGRTRSTSPRRRFAFDLTGDNRTVLIVLRKFYYTPLNVADLRPRRSAVCLSVFYQNANRLLDVPKLGPVRSTQGGAALSRRRNIPLPTRGISTHRERKLPPPFGPASSSSELPQMGPKSTRPARRNDDSHPVLTRRRRRGYTPARSFGSAARPPAGPATRCSQTLRPGV